MALLEEAPMNEPDHLLTTAEVALIVRAPVSTVRYWRYLGTGPKCFKLGRRVVYWRADVSTWLAEREATDRSRAAS